MSRASGLALFMLAAGKPDSAVGWTIVRARSRSSLQNSAACTAPAANSTALSRSRQTSAPFEWNFTHQKLAELLDRLQEPEHAPPLALAA